MTGFTPTPEAVEAAANAIKDQWLSEGPHWLPKDCARAAIAAFVEAEGLTIQTVDAIQAESDENFARLQQAQKALRFYAHDCTDAEWVEADGGAQARAALAALAGENAHETTHETKDV